MRLSTSALGALLLAGLTAFAARSRSTGPVRLDLGGFEGEALAGDWPPADRAGLRPEEAPDGRRAFYFRLLPPTARVRLPVAVSEGGTARLTLRAIASPRCELDVFASGRRVESLVLSPFRWARFGFEVPAQALAGSEIDLALALRAAPLVRGDHVRSPEVRLDYVELEASRGLRLSERASLLLGSVPLATFVFVVLVGLGPWAGLAASLAAAMASLLLGSTAPLPTVTALPRLLPVAFLVGLGVKIALSVWSARPRLETGALAALVAAGILFHGSVVFFPAHNPPDIDIHVWRTLDLRDVPLDYQAILRYGSQLPTPSQARGHATTALGERMLVPYSPLPYVFYLAVHEAGLDLQWAMTVLNAALVMVLVAWLWVVARQLWGRGAAWLGSLLFTLDLSTWHHVGRSHSPAVFGGALGTAALLYLALRAGGLDTPRRAALAGLILGAGVLGYSSLVVLVGLFGLVLLLLLAVDAAGLGPSARRGVAAALVVGGLVAGVLFYFHYVPGLVQGTGALETAPDLFPGRSYFIFDNESRQSLRVWRLGYGIPLLAGLVAAPLALRRVAPAARPILVSWFAAWALIMVLKQPSLLPKLLRWAKEDQFLAPLLCLLVAGAVWSLPRPWLRWGGGALALLTALWLQISDFAYHANTLRL